MDRASRQSIVNITGLVQGSGFVRQTFLNENKWRTIHVEAFMSGLSDAGSIPAASTKKYEIVWILFLTTELRQTIFEYYNIVLISDATNQIQNKA